MFLLTKKMDLVKFPMFLNMVDWGSSRALKPGNPSNLFPYEGILDHPHRKSTLPFRSHQLANPCKSKTVKITVPWMC